MQKKKILHIVIEADVFRLFACAPMKYVLGRSSTSCSMPALLRAFHTLIASVSSIFFGSSLFSNGFLVAGIAPNHTPNHVAPKVDHNPFFYQIFRTRKPRAGLYRYTHIF